MTITSTSTSTTSEGEGPRLRWRQVARGAAPAVALILAVAAWWGLVLWVPLFPRSLGRHLTEWFLRGLLLGYAATLAAAVLGTLGLGAYVLHGRRRRVRVRRPVAARLWLLSASSLIGLAGVEAASALWLIWAHRLPVLPTRFAPAPAGEASIVVIGESSARGFPYQPWLSLGQIVAWQLEEALPGRRFTADVRAEVGTDLERMHQGLAKLTRRPDVLIVYCGHNEFLTRYDSARDAALNEAPLDPILNRLYRLSLHSPCCRLIYETVNKNRLGGPPPPLHQHQLIDPPAVTPSEYADVVADFHRRLEAIVGYCERIGCVPVLVIPPGNEAGFEPNRSVLAGDVPKAEVRRVAEAFAAARALEADEPERALAGYRALLDRHPEFAEAHFRAARLLERLGRFAAANRHYLEARDRDGYPVRCPAPFQEAYRAVARRHGAILVDGPAVLRGICPHGILDDHAFHDAHHPCLAGHVALAEAVLRALHRRQAFGWGEGRGRGRGRAADTSPRPIDPAEAAAHFGIGTEQWVVVCARSATHYRDFSWARYDRSERLAKQRLYEEAGREIARGIPPQETGVPGLGAPPAPDP
jgi:hypothetical protein